MSGATSMGMQQVLFTMEQQVEAQVGSCKCLGWGGGEGLSIWAQKLWAVTHKRGELQRRWLLMVANPAASVMLGPTYQNSHACLK